MTLADNYRFHCGGHFRKIAEDRQRERERRGREKERERVRERLRPRRPQSELFQLYRRLMQEPCLNSGSLTLSGSK